MSSASTDSLQEVSKLSERIQLLEKENTELSKELGGAIGQNTRMCQTIMQLKASRDKLRTKLRSVKQDTGMFYQVDFELLSSSVDVESHPAMREELEKLRKLTETVSRSDADNDDDECTDEEEEETNEDADENQDDDEYTDEKEEETNEDADENQSVKQHRVKLMKQMKEKSDVWRKWKQQKDKDRKRQAEMTKLQQTNQKQQSVLKRKVEEMSSMAEELEKKTAECEELKRMLEQEKRQQLEAEAAAAQRMVCPDTPVLHDEDDIVNDPDWGPVTSLVKSKAGACKCTTYCANRRCSCLKAGEVCKTRCKCTKEKCRNMNVERDVVTNDLPRRRVLRSQTSFMQAVPHGLV